MPPWSKSFLRAANSVIVNLSLSFITRSFVMAVITSDSDLLLLLLCGIRLIGSCESCMQSGCRITLFFLFRAQNSCIGFNPCVSRKLWVGAPSVEADLHSLCTQQVISKLTQCVIS